MNYSDSDDRCDVLEPFEEAIVWGHTVEKEHVHN